MSPEVKPGAGTWGARSLVSVLVSPQLDDVVGACAGGGFGADEGA